MDSDGGKSDLLGIIPKIPYLKKVTQKSTKKKKYSMIDCKIDEDDFDEDASSMITSNCSFLSRRESIDGSIK